jgi:predicted RNase H-like HicB family nuclease
MEFISLTYVTQKEGEYYVSECRELGTSSFGISENEALDALNDATFLYLNTLEELGEAHQVLDEKGVKVYNYEPADLEIRREKFPVGSMVRPTVLSLEHSHA